jgi:hypothetical protein
MNISSFDIAIIIWSGYFITAGILGLSRKRPLIIRYNVLLVLEATSLLLILDSSFTPATLLILIPVLFLVAGTRRPEYYFDGVTKTLFRAALFSTLQKKGMAFEESFLSVRLTSFEVELNGAFYRKPGAARLSTNQSEDVEILQQIVKGMDEYFETTAEGFDTARFRNYCVAGVASLLLLITMKIIW